MPRNPRPPAAHQPAATATARHQAQHLQTPPRSQTATEPTTTSHRTPKLTRFKKGFEWDTEIQLAQAFNRPPRLFKEDTPFYPWLPRPEPLVNFHLNFKF